MTLTATRKRSAALLEKEAAEQDMSDEEEKEEEEEEEEEEEDIVPSHMHRANKRRKGNARHDSSDAEPSLDTLVTPFWPPLRLISAYRGFHLRGAFLLVCPVFCGLSLLPLGTKGHIPYMDQRPLVTHNGKYHRMIWTIYLLGFPYNIWVSGVLKKKNK